MSNKTVIHTDAAPRAIGTYSQAIKIGDLLFLSGQIPLDPVNQTLISTDIDAQIHQVFKNFRAVLHAANADFQHVVKLTIYLTDLTHFARVNDIMSEYCQKPYPARAAVGVAALPRGSLIEIEGIAAFNEMG
jgi:reactive intermediate/imine deaminase